jgi:hypothetical protein
MMLNPFSTDAFDMAALTAAINKIPNPCGRLEQLNLMTPQGVRTRTIIIEEMSGVLNLLPTQPVGAPGTLGTTGKRKVRSFVIPHIPHDDAVLPEEVQGNLKGEFMTGVMCLCSQGFYDAFTTHAKVKEAFMYYQRNQQLGNDYRTAFTFGGVTFEEYRGQATDAAGNVRKFIADDEAHFFPLGTANTFRTHFAPSDFNETANTLGLPLYAKQEPRKFGRGTDLHTQQNPLPICLRPEVLVKGTKA